MTDILIGNGDICISSGGDVIIESVKAEPLVFGEAFPDREIWERTPERRRITVEGYFLSRRKEHGAEECERFRRAVTAAGVQGTGSYIKIGRRYAYLYDCRLSFERRAPFTGEDAEHFKIDAAVTGGFFRSGERIHSPIQTAEGFSLPYYSEGDAAFGTLCEKSEVRVHNRGDIPVGFTAELVSLGEAPYFSLRNDVTGQRIRILRSIEKGDIIRISSVRDNLHMSLTREKREENLTGYAAYDSVLFPVPVGESVISIGGGTVYGGTFSFSEAYFWF